MRKSTGTISLVLLGTAMAVAGCSTRSEEEDDENQATAHRGGHAGVRYVPGFRVGGTGRGGTVTATPSARAGFGGTGAGTIGG
jgi:hypothetical protein